MKITLFDDPIDGDWSERGIQEFREWYQREWPNWFGHQLPSESADSLARLVFRCADDWVGVARRGLQYVDDLLRSDGFEISINVTNLRQHARSRMVLAERRGTITFPIAYFPKFYAAGVCLCEAEHDFSTGRTYSRLTHQDESDPFLRPLGWVTINPDSGRPKFEEPALIPAVNGLVIITLHELAHCLLGHRDRDSGMTSVEMRAQEAEADTFAGVFYAALDSRTDEEEGRGDPFWNPEYAMAFARAAAVVAAFTRSRDMKASTAEPDREHHRATTRYRHLALGALRRLHLIDPRAADIAHAALEAAPARLEMVSFFSPLEKYAEEEDESERDWKSYEAETVAVSRQVAAKLRERRLPTLARLLEPMGLRLDPGEP